MPLSLSEELPQPLPVGQKKGGKLVGRLYREMSGAEAEKGISRTVDGVRRPTLPGNGTFLKVFKGFQKVFQGFQGFSMRSRPGRTRRWARASLRGCSCR